jgi:hypothetical protein
MIGNYKYPKIRKKLSDYYKSICGKCTVVCCTYNTSPVSSYVPLDILLEKEDLVILKKALVFDTSFNKKFRENVKFSLKYLIDRGFARDFFSYLEENDYDIKSFVTVYRGIDARINQFNEEMGKTDRYHERNSDCFFLIPGMGCILEHYRPLVCKMAFRYCFKSLDLYDFVEGNFRYLNRNDFLSYFERDIIINSNIIIPKIITDSYEHFKDACKKLLRENMKFIELEKASYSELAMLADFLTGPFRKPFIKIGERTVSLDLQYIYPLVFIDNLFKGEKVKDFGFGLECVESWSEL